MANLVITSTTNRIKVDFGVYSTNKKIEATKGAFSKSDVSEILLRNDHVDVFMKSGVLNWEVSNSGTDYLVIDSIDGVAPSSLSDLYDKISALVE